MLNLQLPKILNIPKKLLPFILNFDKFNYHLLEGGRGGGKSHSVARFLLFICEARCVRICCGRETQKSIDESVKQIFVDVINQYNLNFDIQKDRIVHKTTGSLIFFKGFREQGRVNIKGLEGIDILWIDEAQAITKPTLDFIIPTIRKVNSRVIFTMNRFVRNDPVFKFCNGRADCQHIRILYFENPYLAQKQLDEAEICKKRNYGDYEHTWLGLPLAQASDYLISASKIDAAKHITFNNEVHSGCRVMSVDLSASGADMNVAKLVVQKSITQWMEEQTITWSQSDTDITKGKIVSLNSLWQPDVLIMDADGLGYPIWVSVKKAIENAIGFRGAGKAKLKGSGNQRADGYTALKDFIDNGWLKLTCENAARQLEYIKRVYKPSGLTYIQDKKEIRKEQSESPDYADALMMAVYVIEFYSNLFIKTSNNNSTSSHSRDSVNSDFDPFDS